MLQTDHRSFGHAGEVRTSANGRAEILKVGRTDVGRLVLGTAPYFQCHVAGMLGVGMDDGTEFVAMPGDVTGDDAWVIANDRVTVVDWFGASDDAR